MQKVTVIIPCYNCEAWVSETLESLEKQTYSDFDVICINDGSTDGTLELLHSWKKKGSLQLSVVDQPNGGVSRARNSGIRLAKGTYILFLDADDLYHPCLIDHMVSAVENNKTDVAYCRLSRNKQKVMIHQENVDLIRKDQSQMMHDLMYRMGEFGFYCYIYRRELLEKVTLEFDVNTRRWEDREFNWKYLCHCNTAILVDAPLYYYRMTENSVTQRKCIIWNTEGIEAVKRVEAYMAEMKCSFFPELKSYLFARIIWTNAKNYAVSGEKTLFFRLQKEYDVSACMKRTAKDRSMLVSIASWMYLIHPMLFYYVVRLKS